MQTFCILFPILALPATAITHSPFQLSALPIPRDNVNSTHGDVQLIDPSARFSGMNLTIPPQTYPALQTSFETPPDCGETTYKGSGKLRGLKTLITGGDSGIGRAVVIAFLREGAKVAINYLPEEEPDALDLANFLDKEGLKLERIPGDLRNESFCTHLVHEAAARLGGLDILVSNAGYNGNMFGPLARPIANASTEEIDRIWRTNVYAGFFLTRAAIPLLPRGGSILFTSSNAAENPSDRGIAYGASKAAITFMIRSLAIHLAPNGIRVNGVAPALVFSPFLAAMGMTTEMLGNATSAGQFPVGRVMQPAELAGLYVSLADPWSTYTSGTIYSASGATLAV